MPKRITPTVVRVTYNRWQTALWLAALALVVLALVVGYALVQSDVARLRADSARIRAAIATERVRTDALEAEVPE